MNKQSLRSVALAVALCFLAAGVASADSFTLVPFPTAGDAYCSATDGCGTIPGGGQTGFMNTAGDYVISSVFVLPTSSVTDLTANWQFQDFLGSPDGINPSTETWYVYINGVAVAQTILPDDNYNGDIGTVSGTVNFAGIAPVAGGYQIELILQNTVDLGGGSVAWLDGGTTELSYAAPVPEPGSMALLGSGILGMAGAIRRKLSL